MFSNIGGLEVLFVLVVALIVLGPTKLPEAARQVGKFVTEVRRISSGFQREFREAIQEPIIEAEARARGAVEGTKRAVADPFLKPDEAAPPASAPPSDTESGEPATDGNGSDDD